ncbi:MAG: thioredoxin [Clostridia bacterium]|nr:thioredoxin [Clostridia bacterium]
MKEIILTKSNFNEEVLNANGVVLVDFWASWCGPCMMLSPVIEEIANEGKVKVGKVNVDDEMDLAVQYGIEVIPTLIFFKNGQKVKQTSGVMDKADIEKIIATL